MGAFALYINDQKVVLFPNTKIKFLIKSPLFQTEIEPPSRSFNIDIPANENNFIFEYASVLSSRNRLFVVDGKTYLKGKFWKNVKVYIDAFSPIKYTIRIAFDKGYFTDIGKSTLRSFKYENPTKYRAFKDSVTYRQYQFSVLPWAPSTGPATALLMTLDNPVDKSITHNYRIVYNAGETITTFINRIISTVNADFKIHGNFAEAKPSDTIQFTNYWGNGQYASIGFTPVDLDYYNYLDDPVFTSGYSANVPRQQTLHANDVVANPGNYDYVFFPVRVPGFAQTGSGFNFSGVVNDYAPVAIDTYTPGFRGMGPFGENNKNGYTPSAYVYDVLRMIHEEMGIKVVDHFFDDELKKLVIWSPVLRDYNWNGDNWYSPTFLYADILPDVTYGELIQSLAGLFGFIPYFDSVRKQVTYTSRKNVINSQEDEDWSDISGKLYNLKRIEKALKHAYTFADDEEDLYKSRVIEPGDVLYNYKGEQASLPSSTVSANKDLVLLKSKNHYFGFTSYFGGGEWIFLGEQLQNTLDRDAQTEIKVPAAPTFSDVFSTNYIRTPSPKIIKWLLPYSNAVPEFISRQKSKWPIRLLFYRGMQPGEYQAGSDPNVLTSFNYPLAHYHNYNYAGTKVGNYSLAFGGEDGVINKFLKEWIEFVEQGDPITFSVKITEQQLRNLDVLKKKRIHNQLFLIDEVEVTIGDEIEIATVKAYQTRKNYEQ